MYKFFFKHFVRNKKITSFNSFLFIGPHPDDIEFGCGAFVSWLASSEKKKKITFLICTDGRYGNKYLPDSTEEEIIAIRKSECLKAALLLGVENVLFLPYSDGGFYNTDNMKRSIAEVISEVQPDILFAPDPDVSSECHPDHKNIGEIAKTLFAVSSNKLLLKNYGVSASSVEALAFYFTSRPNQKAICRKSLYKNKIKALYAHKSQFPYGDASTKIIIRYLKLKRYLFRKDEAFRVIDKLHSHCFPEADF